MKHDNSMNLAIPYALLVREEIKHVKAPLDPAGSL